MECFRCNRDKLGAFATFIAIIVALWQTKIAYKKKADIVFSDNASVMLNDKLVPVVTFAINNVGNKDLVINSLKYGIKPYDIVVLPTYLKIKTIQFPYELKQEHSASLVMQKEDFVKTLDDLVKDNQSLKKKKLKIVVTDSVGTIYTLNLNKTPNDYITKQSGGK